MLYLRRAFRYVGSLMACYLRSERGNGLNFFIKKNHWCHGSAGGVLHRYASVLCTLVPLAPRTGPAMDNPRHGLIGGPSTRTASGVESGGLFPHLAYQGDVLPKISAIN